MPFCPNCHWEYVEGTKTCSDCGAGLKVELEPEKFPEDIETAQCFVAHDEIEAEIIKGILHQNSIPCILTSQYSHHPFSIGVSGEVGILVPRYHHDESIHIIKEFQAQKGVIDDEFKSIDGDDLDDYGNQTDLDDELSDVDGLDHGEDDLLDDDHF